MLDFRLLFWGNFTSIPKNSSIFLFLSHIFSYLNGIALLQFFSQNLYHLTICFFIPRQSFSITLFISLQFELICCLCLLHHSFSFLAFRIVEDTTFIGSSYTYIYFTILPSFVGGKSCVLYTTPLLLFWFIFHCLFSIQFGGIVLYPLVDDFDMDLNSIVEPDLPQLATTTGRFSLDTIVPKRFFTLFFTSRYLYFSSSN